MACPSYWEGGGGSCEIKFSFRVGNNFHSLLQNNLGQSDVYRHDDEPRQHQFDPQSDRGHTDNARQYYSQNEPGQSPLQFPPEQEQSTDHWPREEPSNTDLFPIPMPTYSSQDSLYEIQEEETSDYGSQIQAACSDIASLSNSTSGGDFGGPRNWPPTQGNAHHQDPLSGNHQAGGNNMYTLQENGASLRRSNLVENFRSMPQHKHQLNTSSNNNGPANNEQNLRPFSTLGSSGNQFPENRQQYRQAQTVEEVQVEQQKQPQELSTFRNVKQQQHSQQTGTTDHIPSEKISQETFESQHNAIKTGSGGVAQGDNYGRSVATSAGPAGPQHQQLSAHRAAATNPVLTGEFHA